MLVDLSPKMGGEDAGPNPGMLGRGALATCVAMNAVMRAAVRGIVLDKVHVRVEADYDARGEMMPGAGDPGYSHMRVELTVESRAPRSEVELALEEAKQTTAFLDTFRRPVDVTLVTNLIAADREEAA
ncbi:MAG: OsmC family protein [Bryobacterales bacterium]